MGYFNRLSTNRKSEILFNQALEKFNLFRSYPVFSEEYHQVLVEVIKLCQAAIRVNDRHGDAHVLLANTLYLAQIDGFSPHPAVPPLLLADAVIQHWRDEPMRQCPWTSNIDNGHKMYAIISRDLKESTKDLKFKEENTMRMFKETFYQSALTS